jgi:uncharacterized phage protein gp47/JayE
MPWQTPTLRDVRSIVRDNIRAALPGADASIPNSVLRVLSDNQGALCHLTLQYIDWLALQLLPDTAETEWLDRHGDIWLVNADGTTGRKLATPAYGTATFTGPYNSTIPVATQMLGSGSIGFETTADIYIGPSLSSDGPIRALDPGSAGNLPAGTGLAVDASGVQAVVVDLDGGTDEETDEELRARVLRRIRMPPQGGAAHDYVAWALAVPGCTRAWCTPNEMGIGTVTVRVMFDELRADNGGFPLPQDLAAVEAYLDTVRPVAVKDFWVLSPIPQPIDFNLLGLVPYTDSVKAAIEQSILDMLYARAAPGQTIFAAWKYATVMEAPGVVSFSTADSLDDVMESPGHMAVLGDIYYG